VNQTKKKEIQIGGGKSIEGETNKE